MPINIDGNGSIGGLVAGGLPDATVQTADLVDASVTAAKLSGAQTGAAPVYGCRAWAIFNGTLTGTNAPIAGGNITSITRTAAGTYTVNISTAIDDANYSAVATSTTAAAFVPAARTTTSFTVTTTNSGGTATDSAAVSVAIFR